MTVPVGMISTQAAIVGAGPTGATIANYLGMYGVDTVLMDRSASIIDYPRAVGMDDECLRSFQAIGLADELLPHIIQNVALRFFDARQRCFATVRPATGSSAGPGETSSSSSSVNECSAAESCGTPQ